MIKEIYNKIGQLQYEIGLLELDKETLTAVSVRTDELSVLVKSFIMNTRCCMYCEKELRPSESIILCKKCTE